MIKLFSVKEKQKQEATAAKAGPRQTSGELRLQKDISELNLASTTSIHFPNGKEKLLNFEVTINPDEGYHKYVLHMYFCGGMLYCHSISEVHRVIGI